MPLSPTSRVAVLALAGAAAGALACDARAQQTYQSERHSYRVVTVVEGLTHPWGMVFLPNGDMLVTEKRGTLRLVKNGRLEPEPISGVPAVRASGQGGLLDVALHPDYASNQLVYLSFSKPGPRGATTAVVRGRFSGTALTNVQEIFEATAWSNGGSHFGSRLAFDRQGYLFITVGERGNMREAQNLMSHNGTHIRLHDDGRVPTDNPFVGRTDALPEIWTYGNRNPQGLTVHPTTGAVWSAEHGPRGGDELNLIQRGRNYGWPVITYGINYNGSVLSEFKEKEGMEQPTFYFVPSIATSGLAIYHGDKFPNWRGDAFIGGLAGSHVARINLGAGGAPTHEKLVTLGHRIRDVRVGPDGFLYLLVDAARAPMLRMEPGR